ncbi:MAG: Short-chain dehydrogenase [Rhodobacteraceae bacterium]|nr:MAG: Short-chain dehydrogenase [Paracoccaceae bacterium]
MLVKTIILFLALMVLVALIGRALFPTALPRVMQKRKAVPVCNKCGRHLIGTKSCDCGGKAR